MRLRRRVEEPSGPPGATRLLPQKSSEQDAKGDDGRDHAERRESVGGREHGSRNTGGGVLSHGGAEDEDHGGERDGSWESSAPDGFSSIVSHGRLVRRQMPAPPKSRAAGPRPSSTTYGRETALPKIEFASRPCVACIPAPHRPLG